MKRLHQTIGIILGLLCLCSTQSCGIAMNASAASDIAATWVEVDGEQLTIYLDDHRQSRKNADEVFTHWTEHVKLKGYVKKKTLRSIAPKKDGCRLTYDFKTAGGNVQRVVLNVHDYRQEYRKQKNKSKVYDLLTKEYKF